MIFEENSYSSIQTLDLSRFTQLKTLIVKNGAFANCYHVYLDNPELKVIDIGDNCFTGVPPTGEARRLAGFSFGLVFANLPSLKRLTIVFYRMQGKCQLKLQSFMLRPNLKNIVSFRTGCLCLTLISTCWNWKKMRRSNRIASLF